MQRWFEASNKVAPKGAGTWFGRVTLRRVGESTGCMVQMPDSLGELLHMAVERLGLAAPPVALFAATGDEIGPEDYGEWYGGWYGDWQPPAQPAAAAAAAEPDNWRRAPCDRVD